MDEPFVWEVWVSACSLHSTPITDLKQKQSYYCSICVSYSFIYHSQPSITNADSYRLIQPVYISAIEIFQDGGLKHNNPVNLILWESHQIWCYNQGPLDQELCLMNIELSNTDIEATDIQILYEQQNIRCLSDLYDI